jgi:general secretion pathway protein G
MKKDHPKRFFRGDQNVGFTLVEILVTVSVIGILAGIVLAAAGAVQTKAARDQTLGEVRTMGLAVERYRTDMGFFPTSTVSSSVLYRYISNYMSFRTNQLSGQGTNTQILDPYGRPYFYESPNRMTGKSLMAGSEESFRIWSGGPNGSKTTNDDVGIW